jgi:hypothetical protein
MALEEAVEERLNDGDGAQPTDFVAARRVHGAEDIPGPAFRRKL